MNESSANTTEQQDDIYSIDQPGTKVYRNGDGSVMIEQVELDSDTPSVVYIHPIFLPTFIEWLSSFLPKAK